MSNGNQPAMPVPLNPGSAFQGHGPADGLTKREHFAAMAMQGILSNPQYFRELQDQAVELDNLGHDCDVGKLVSELSWEYADAFLSAQSG